MPQKQIQLSNYYIKKDGSNGNVASSSAKGLMSATDKNKLDNITASSNTPTADTNSGSAGGANTTAYAKADHSHPKSNIYAAASHDHDVINSTYLNTLIEDNGEEMHVIGNIRYDYSGTSEMYYFDSDHNEHSFDNIEETTNKVSSWSSTTNNTRYPTEKLVKDSLNALNTEINNLMSNSIKIEIFEENDIEGLVLQTDIDIHDNNSGIIFSEYCNEMNMDIEANTIYLVPNNSFETSYYYEFIVLDDGNNGVFSELIGTTDIDLSNYVTTSSLTSTLNGYATTSALNGKANSSHPHGNITNDGKCSTTGTVDVSRGDLLLFADATNNQYTIKGSSFVDALNDLILDLINEGE